MNRFCAALFVLVLLTTNAIAQGELSPALDADLEKKVDDYFNPLVECGLFSGAVLIARDGKVVVHKSYGKANFESDVQFDVSHRTKLMSVTKAMTATTVMTLVSDGILNLEDKASLHLPGFPARWSDVTVRQLLSHSSLIPNCESDWTQLEMKRGGRGIALWAELAETLADRELMSKTGYSNFNYVLLGLICEKVTGEKFPELVKKQLFEPAGMQQSGFDDGSRFDELAVGYMARENGQPGISMQDMSRIQAAGGVYSTVGDLFLFDRALHSNRLFSESIRSKMYEPTTEWFCQGWSITPRHGRRCISHSGGANGYVADLLRFTDDNACVAVTSNLAFSPITKISSDLAAILFEMPVNPAVIHSDELLEQYPGVYSAERTGHHVIVRRFGKTTMVFGYWPATAQCSGRINVPVSEGVFAGSGVKYRFTKSRGGDIELTEEHGQSVYRLRKRMVNVESLALLGKYQAGENERATVSDDDGLATLRSSDVFPHEMELVRLSNDLALGIFNHTGGVVIKIETTGDDRTILQWRQYDGREIRLESE